MKINHIKLLVTAAFIFAFAIISFNTPNASALSPVDEDVAASYKKQCAMCHSPKAEKAFDPAKPVEEHVQIILKGKKGEKPPYMPGYEAKGMTAEQAKALTEYMISLRKPAE